MFFTVSFQIIKISVIMKHLKRNLWQSWVKIRDSHLNKLCAIYSKLKSIAVIWPCWFCTQASIFFNGFSANNYCHYMLLMWDNKGVSPGTGWCCIASGAQPSFHILGGTFSTCDLLKKNKFYKDINLNSTQTRLQWT